MENQEAVKRILDVINDVPHEKQNQILHDVLNEIQNVRQHNVDESEKNVEYHSVQLKEFWICLNQINKKGKL